MAECQELLADSENEPIQEDKEKVVKLLKEFSCYFICKIEKLINLCRNVLEGNPEKHKNSKTVEVIGGAAAAIPGFGKVLQEAIKEVENSLKHIDIKSKGCNLANLITNYNLQPDKIRMVLMESALYIFYSYETQFLKVTCEKGNDSRAMMKLGEDASERVFNYLITHSKDLEDEPFSRNLVTKGLVEGKSSLSTTTVLRCMKRGRSITNVETKIFWTTKDLFNKPGIILESPNNEMEFYDKSTRKIDPSTQSPQTKLDEDDPVSSEDLNQFGYRRAFPWENTDKIHENYVKKLIVDEQPKFILNKNDFNSFFSQIQNHVMNRKLNEGDSELKLNAIHKDVKSTHSNTEKILKSATVTQENVRVIRNNQENNCNLMTSVNKEEIGYILSRIQDNRDVNDCTNFLDLLVRQSLNNGSKIEEYINEVATTFTTLSDNEKNFDYLKKLVQKLHRSESEENKDKVVAKKAFSGLLDFGVAMAVSLLSQNDNNDH